MTVEFRRALLPAAILVLIAFAAVFSRNILFWMGAILVTSEPPQKADTVEVLGGDSSGNRVMKGCELVRAGFAPKAFITGQASFYGVHESKLAVDFAGTQGCPADYFIRTDFPALSTVSELNHLTSTLRALGMHKVLLVTSPSHTARATRVFRRLAPDLEIHTVASDDPKWNNGYWWKTREGRKTWLFEIIKTGADFFGI
jgi:uncharacterized SAM-binding protein YcdF (DUF218 family)